MTSPLSRLLALGLLFVALAACTADDAAVDVDQGAETPPADSDATPEAQDERTQLVVGAPADQYSREEPHASVGVSSPNTNIFEPLVYLDENYQTQPLLVDSWEFVEPDSWQLELRPDVAFHNGDPLTAEAVEQGMIARAVEAGGHTIKAGPESVTILDEHTFEFTPAIPNLRVMQQILHPGFPVHAPGTSIGEEPVGTGPFRFMEYRPDEVITVERNEDYWGEPARLERIDFRFYPDATSRRLALESGEIDFAYQIARSDLRNLEEQGFQILQSPVGTYQVLFTNLHGEPPYDLMQDETIRRAVAQAIDREALVTEVFDGYGTTDQTFVPPELLGEHAGLVEGIDHDPEAASSLLEEAGWEPGADGILERDGRRLELVLVSGYPSAEANRPVPEFVQAELAEIGIQVDIVDQPDSSSFRDEITKGAGDLFLEQRTQNDGDPSFLPVVFLSDISEGGAAPYQALFNPGEPFNQLLRESVTASDPDEVRRLTAEAMHELIDEQVGVIQLAGLPTVYVAASDVQGFVAHPSESSVRWDTVHLAAD